VELDHLVSQRPHHLAAVQRVQMETDLDRLLEVDERAEPAGADGPRIAGDDQRAGVLVIEANVVASDLDRGRRDEIGERTSAEGEAPLVGRKRAPWFGCALAEGDEWH